MSNVIIEKKSKTALEACILSGAQAVLLSGPSGVGLQTIARWMADEWGETIDIVTPEAKTKNGVPAISVERIRELYATTKSKSHKQTVAIIDDADTMSEPAQNALLKLLEEPNSSVHFIVTTHAPGALLPTILSRLQRVYVQKVDSATTVRLIKRLGIEDESKKKQLLYVANGLPSAITRLAEHPELLEIEAATVRKARDFIRGTAYERMLIVQDIGNDRAKALHFIDTVLIMLKNSAISTADRSILTKIDTIMDMRENIVANGNVRLQMTTTVV